MNDKVQEQYQNLIAQVEMLNEKQEAQDSREAQLIQLTQALKNRANDLRQKEEQLNEKKAKLE